jgi:RNA polymerase sigma factor (sigma-70 family)
MPPLSLEEAYVAYRPVLFRALASLARRGYVVPIDDTLDVIHDFFVEAWDGLSQRFDPEKGTFEAYLYVAFVQFARPRIARVARLSRSLQHVDALSEASAEEPAPLDEGDQRRVRAAMARLRDEPREALTRFFSADRASEREVARAMGVSRHQLRNWLVEGLGELSVSLKVDRSPDDDWRVAEALWRDGLSEEEAARALHRTPAQVRAAHRRNTAALTAALAAAGGRARS